MMCQVIPLSKKARMKAKAAGPAATKATHQLPFKSMRFTNQGRRPAGSGTSGQSSGQYEEQSDVQQVKVVAKESGTLSCSVSTSGKRSFVDNEQQSDARC